MVKRKNLLAEILSAHVPLKRIRHMSSHDDVTSGCCPICCDEVSATLHRIDEKILEEIFPEKGLGLKINELGVVCGGCLKTFKEFQDLKLEKLKIEKRIEQIRCCIRALVHNKIVFDEEENIPNQNVEGKMLIEKEEGLPPNNFIELELSEGEIDVEKEYKTEVTAVDEHQKIVKLKKSAVSKFDQIEQNIFEDSGQSEETEIKTERIQSSQFGGQRSSEFRKKPIEFENLAGITPLHKQLDPEKSENLAEFKSKSLEIDYKTREMGTNSKLSCNICGKKFSRESSVARHLKSKVCTKDHENNLGDNPTIHVFVSDSESDFGEVKVEICEDIQDEGQDDCDDQEIFIDQNHAIIIVQANEVDIEAEDYNTHFQNEKTENQLNTDEIDNESDNLSDSNSEYEPGETESELSKSDSEEEDLPRNQRSTRSTSNPASNSKAQVVKDHLEVASTLHCKACRLNFINNKEARSHMKSKVHKNMLKIPIGERDEFKCAHEFCGKSFSVIGDLISHLKGHKWSCEICNFSFINLIKIMEHLCSKGHKLKAGPQPKILQNLEKFMKYPCSSCQKRFLSIRMLKAHEGICNRGAGKKFSYKKVEGPDDEKSFNCDICKTEIIGSKTFQVHLDSDAHIFKALFESDGSYKCFQKDCGQIFESVDDFVQHFHKECSFCNSHISNRRSYVYHLSTERHAENCGTEAIEAYAKLKTRPCSLCDKSFVTTLQLRKHQKTHMLSFTCEICGKNSSSERHLQLHQRTHEEKAPKEPKEPIRSAPPKLQQILCKQCGKGFSQKSALYSHRRNYHKGNEFKCSQCPNIYAGFPGLQRHQKTAHGTKEEREIVLNKFKGTEICGICGRIFKGKSNYVVHMELFHLHSKDLCPGGCELAEPFKNDEEWRMHLEDCRSEKLGEPAICFFCKGIYPNCLLRLHHQLQSHKSYKCEHCQQSFTKPATLRRHHCDRDKQNFLCPKCGKSFKAMYNLNLHLTIVCNDDEASKKALAEKRKKKYMDFRKKSDKNKCGKCSKRFVNEKKLKEHLETGHKSDDETS